MTELIGVARRPAVLAVALTLLLAACSSGGPSTEQSGSAQASADATASPSEAAPDFVLVAIGDSIPYNLEDDCPGCTGFVDSYAAALEAELGEPVAVINRSRHDGAQTSDILEQLGEEDRLLEELASADVIILSVGFNDQPPFGQTHEGCPERVAESDSLETAVQRAVETSQECMDSVMEEIRVQYVEVLEAIRAQAPDAAIAALTSYDSWLGWSALDSLDEPTRSALYDKERYWQQRWRDVMCAQAEALAAVCVDLYSAFNGPDGTDPPTDFVAADYTHPSQEGNDVIRDLLIEANLTEGQES